MRFGENPERQAIANSLDITNERENFVIDNAYKRAESIIEKSAIDPQKFISDYPAKDLSKDMEYVRRIQEDIKSKPIDTNKKCATVLEAIVLDEISNGGWFGQSAKAKKTSLYDDYHNGIDMILTFKEDALSSHIGLAIDATFGNSAIISEKINRVVEGIQRGKLAEIKYFETENYRGILKNIPRIIVGVDRKHVVSLAGMWVDPTEREKLSAHPTQRVLLREGIRQLEYFAIVAKKAGKNELTPIFEQNADILRRVARYKGVQGINAGNYDKDGVLATIEQLSKVA